MHQQDSCISLTISTCQDPEEVVSLQTKGWGSDNLPLPANQNFCHWWQQWGPGQKGRRPRHEIPRRATTHTPNKLQKLREEIEERGRQAESPKLCTPITQRENDLSLVEELLFQLTQMNTRKAKFKPLQFSGTTDVELFISQFNDVAKANFFNDKKPHYTSESG